MTHRGAGAPGAGLPYQGSEVRSGPMKAIRMMVVAAIFAAGCDETMTAPTDGGLDTGSEVDTGVDTGPPVERYMCGQSVGQRYTAHFTQTSGSCMATVDLDVTIGDLNDFCQAVGGTRTDVFSAGLCAIGCYIDTAACHVYAAIGCNGCQGSYTIKFTAK